jgi:hypothetical protein
MAGFVFSGSMGLALSVASVPLSGCYTFVDSFQAPIVLVTGFIAVASPHLIAACFAGKSNMNQKRKELVWASAMALSACASAFLQRGHLFVWSVFGPLVAWQAVYLAVTIMKIAV